MSPEREPGKGKPMSNNDLESMLETFRTRRQNRSNQKTEPAAQERKPERVSEKQSPHYEYNRPESGVGAETSDARTIPAMRTNAESDLKEKLRQKQKKREEERKQKAAESEPEAEPAIARISAPLMPKLGGLTPNIKPQESDASRRKVQGKKKPCSGSVIEMLREKGGIKRAIILTELLGQPRAFRDF